MIGRAYAIRVLEAPKSMNAGGGGSRVHWAKAHREKKQWEELFLAEFMVARMPRNPAYVEVEIVVNWRRDTGADSTNYFSAVVKPLADACQQWGLPNDTDEFFAVRGFRFAFPSTWPRAYRRLSYVEVHLLGVWA